MRISTAVQRVVVREGIGRGLNHIIAATHEKDVSNERYSAASPVFSSPPCQVPEKW